MLLENPAIQFNEYIIPNGRDGVIATLKLMRQLVREYKRNPDIVYLSRRLVQSVPQKDWINEIRALFLYVRDNIRYTRDINEVETLASPTRLIELGSGDCDDKATLLASMLESVGHPARFVAVGPEDDLEHVYVETRVGNHWLALDPTEDVDIGWNAPNMRARFVMHI